VVIDVLRVRFCVSAIVCCMFRLLKRGDTQQRPGISISYTWITYPSMHSAIGRLILRSSRILKLVMVRSGGSGFDLSGLILCFNATGAVQEDTSLLRAIGVDTFPGLVAA